MKQIKPSRHCYLITNFDVENFFVLLISVACNSNIGLVIPVDIYYVLVRICIYFLQLKEVARKFNSLPERQAKVNYLLASQEKAEAAKVKVN